MVVGPFCSARKYTADAPNNEYLLSENCDCTKNVFVYGALMGVDVPEAVPGRRTEGEMMTVRKSESRCFRHCE